MLKRIVLILGLFLAGQGMAAEVQDLFEIEVQVDSYSAPDRNAAARQALSQVLRRTTSQPDKIDSKSMQRNINRAPALLKSYQYVEKSEGLGLKVSFPAVEVQRLLGQANLPYWGEQRPRILLWVAVKNGNRWILSDMEASPEALSVREAAQRRAIPVQLPLMDLDDSQKVFFSDVWARFPEVLEPASTRYRPDGFAALRVYPSGTSWRGDWLLSENERIREGRLEGQSSEKVLAGMIDAIADQLASEYALVLKGDDARQRLQLTGIRSMQDLVKAKQALNSLDQISQVELLQLNGDSVMLSLKLVGEAKALQRALGLNRHFRSQEEGVVTGVETLSYIWVP